MLICLFALVCVKLEKQSNYFGTCIYAESNEGYLQRKIRLKDLRDIVMNCCGSYSDYIGKCAQQFCRELKKNS